MPQTKELFIPDIYPSRGGIGLHQNGKHITISDGEVERFIDEIQAIRRKQLIDDCMKAAKGAAHA